MSDLDDLVQGDSREYAVLITNQSGQAIDLTGAIVKFAAKANPATPDVDAEIFKTSYDASEIDITDPTAGECTVYLLSSDTVAIPPRRLAYDIEVTRAGASVTTAGTLTVAADSGTVVGAGVDFESVRIGDLLDVAGSGANAIRVTVESVDADAGTLTTDFLGWADESSIAFEIFRGDVKTPDGLRGILPIVASVVL